MSENTNNLKSNKISIKSISKVDIDCNTLILYIRYMTCKNADSNEIVHEFLNEIRIDCFLSDQKDRFKTIIEEIILKLNGM